MIIPSVTTQKKTRRTKDTRGSSLTFDLQALLDQSRCILCSYCFHQIRDVVVLLHQLETFHDRKACHHSLTFHLIQEHGPTGWQRASKHATLLCSHPSNTCHAPGLFFCSFIRSPGILGDVVDPQDNEQVGKSKMLHCLSKKKHVHIRTPT